MRLIQGLPQAQQRLARLDLGPAIEDALDQASQKLETAVSDVLSQPPGQDHTAPWLRSGSLRASIGHDVDGQVAVVGSSSDVAVDQELGTSTVPPRPFLASTAAVTADDVAASIAAALAAHFADY